MPRRSCGSSKRTGAARSESATVSSRAPRSAATDSSRIRSRSWRERRSWCSACSDRRATRFWLTPVEKKERRELADQRRRRRRGGRPRAVRGLRTRRPGERARRCGAGRSVRAQSFSLIAIHKYELPHEFSDAAIDEAKRVAKQPLGEREDLTHLPIVAIDPADARDHDDAIWAARDEDDDNKGGWKAIVAIADVSFYVRPNPRSTRRRGRAATASISPTASCRCCPKSCRPTSAR